MFLKIGALKKFRSIHRKTPFNKVAGLKTCSFFKRDSNIGVFR